MSYLHLQSVVLGRRATLHLPLPLFHVAVLRRCLKLQGMWVMEKII